MRTKRINTELYDTITVTDKSGNAIDFSNAYDINLYLQKQGSSTLLKQNFSQSGNTLKYQFNSDENNRGLGIYDLHLEWKKKDANSELTYDQYHFDYLGCFKIVHLSDEENWSEGVSGTVLQFGADGLSAYEVAVKEGFVGTITEWLASLEADVTKKNVEAVLTGDITSHNHSSQIAEILKSYVQKVAGYGLSKNDFTDALLTKLNNLNNYDDANVKKDIATLNSSLNTLLNGNASNAIESFNEIIAFLNNVSDTATLSGIISGINTTIANNLTEAKEYADAQISAHNKSTTAHEDIRTYLSNKVDKDGTKVLSTNDFTTVLKDKLINLSNYDDTALAGRVTAVETWKAMLTGTSADNIINTFKEVEDFLAGITGAQSLAQMLSQMRTDIINLIPTNNNQLTNGAGYQTSTNVSSAITTALSAYLTTDEVNTLISSEAKTRGDADTTLQNNIDKKVDKVDGKGLSTNDYDNTEKAQVATNKKTNSIQDTVVAEALAKLNQEFEALKEMLLSGNIGDVHVTSINTDTVPMYCGQCTIIKGSGSPVTNAVIPDFEGQIYVDTTNRNAYMCCDSSSYSYWKLLN